MNLRAQTAIVGLGDTEYFGKADETPIALARASDRSRLTMVDTATT